MPAPGNTPPPPNAIAGPAVPGMRDHARFRGSSSPDLNPIERLWDWMREAVTRGHCHISLATLRAACRRFIAEINGDPEAVRDRLWPKFELDPEYEAKLLVST
jgi:hypothetical protein